MNQFKPPNKAKNRIPKSQMWYKMSGYVGSTLLNTIIF